MKILGAGLAGLLAGVMNQDAWILEPFGKRQSHQALLRFRSPQIGEAVGIPFQKVRVHKAIWLEKNDYPCPSPKAIVQYARKVSGSINTRSIANLETEDRWIAPEDFQEQLQDICSSRIEYDCDVYERPILPDKIISTLPIHVMAKMLEIEMPESNAPKHKSIYVNSYRIPNCNVYMTTYHPSFKTSVYRASITRDLLIIESTREATEKEIEDAVLSLGLQGSSMDDVKVNFEQKNGKIWPIDEAWRKEFIYQATMKHDVYSLGRFATWRNIVLDDVYHDILKIKQFIHRDKYDHHKGYTI